MIKRILVILNMMFCSVIQADSLQTEGAGLDNQADVYISAWVGDKPIMSKSTPESSVNEFVVNEQVILTIEVATSGWFTQGTRIGYVETNNAIAMQRNPLAINYTQRENGKTWAKQRWEVTLYPQAEGQVSVPSIPVQVAIASPKGGQRDETLYTNPINFDVKWPLGIENGEAWFAASEAILDQQWTLSNDSLNVGDTITRTISLQAQDALSVLLPSVLLSHETQTPSQYQPYPSPRSLHDSQFRGKYLSKQIEQVTYVLQEGGEIWLPTYQVHWWNSETQAMVTMMVEGQTFTIKHTWKSWLKSYGVWLAIMMLSTVVIILLMVAIHRYYQHNSKPQWYTFRQQLNNKQWSQARALLYKKQRQVTGSIILSDDAQSSIKQDINDLIQGKQCKRQYQRVWRTISEKYLFERIKSRLKIPKVLPALKTVSKE
ncbi:hypothetical protein BCU68_14495 [Vibrio sp. 10N.286.49.B3]|uniref:BatD family protein n=1 Tax=Vibrio sp. 10N.286.49.B3 TaxID=1880855 RepID=UPI000CB0FF46|nr:BatD family protein [Vibrio sp. 10N.286.49.B3]PMH42213.1 hypothetical protein BCU68_14495 [Vibrio sp. 10N.286.49.B3]